LKHICGFTFITIPVHNGSGASFICSILLLTPTPVMEGGWRERWLKTIEAPLLPNVSLALRYFPETLFHRRQNSWDGNFSWCYCKVTSDTRLKSTLSCIYYNYIYNYYPKLLLDITLTRFFSFCSQYFPGSWQYDITKTFLVSFQWHAKTS